MTTIFTDATTLARTYDVTGIIDAADRRLHREVAQSCDCPFQDATLGPRVNERHDINSGDRTGGTFELDFILDDTWEGSPGGAGQTFTVAGLAWNEAAAAVQTAVDAAAIAAGIGKYINGDIAVSGGPFGAAGADTLFLFQGDSVQGNHTNTNVDGAGLTGGTIDPASAQVGTGTPSRFYFAALLAMGTIERASGPFDPLLGVAPAGQFSVTPRDQLENYPSNSTIRKLVREATIWEGQDWDSELLPLFNIQP